MMYCRNKKKAILTILSLLLLLGFTACRSAEAVKEEEPVATAETAEKEEENKSESKEAKEMQLYMRLADTEVEVAWEENETVAALKELAGEAGLTVELSMYGGFEQVGSLGQKLPRNDQQTTTASGDIVLYSGDQIVVFYGPNAWAYTRIGHISNKTPAEMTELLSKGDVSVTFYCAE